MLLGHPVALHILLVLHEDLTDLALYHLLLLLLFLLFDTLLVLLFLLFGLRLFGFRLRLLGGLLLGLLGKQVLDGAQINLVSGRNLVLGQVSISLEGLPAHLALALLRVAR
jgi:hypothetical protein